MVLIKKDQINILNNTKIAAIPDQVSTNLEDEAVILSLKDGVYYGLNPVGARIWELLQVPRTVAELSDIILQEYNVEPSQCQDDLVKLLNELASRGLIELQDEKAG